MNAPAWAATLGMTAYAGMPMSSTMAVYTRSVPLPLVNGPLRRRLTIGSMAVASRMAMNSRKMTSWTRHNKYRPMAKAISTSPARATSSGGNLLETTTCGW